MKSVFFLLGTCMISLTSLASQGISKKPLLESRREVGECRGIAPRTLAYVCNRFQSSSGTIQCFQAGKGAYLSQCGMGVCDRYQSENGTVGCIQAIRNKEFDIAALEACDRIITEQSTTDCLLAIGYPNGSALDIADIRKEVRSALYEIEDGYYREAEKVLRRLLRTLEESPTPNLNNFNPEYF